MHGLCINLKSKCIDSVIKNQIKFFIKILFWSHYGKVILTVKFISSYTVSYSGCGIFYQAQTDDGPTKLTPDRIKV